MSVDEATRQYLLEEATHHCSEVWPVIMEYKFGRDPLVLSTANLYLGQLRSSEPLIYEIVMEMLSKASGASWAAIRDAMS